MADFIAGIDVSHHQKPIDWQRVATAGYRYAFVRASYGSKLKDRRFSEHWSGATAAGLLVSAYHFMRTSNPVAEQVDFFLDVLGDRKPDLPLALDVEADPFPAEDAPLSRAAWTQWTVECLDRIEAAGHRRPILYTAGAFWNANLERSERWSGHDLWVAHYTAAAQPRLPLDWRSWRFWQFTSQGQVPGVDGNTDVNRLPGTEADLLAYAGRAAGPAPVTPLLQARVDAPVNVRSGPSIKFDRVGMLTAADVGRLLPVHDIGGSDAWIRIAANRWVACSAPGGPLCRVEVAPDGRVQAHVLGTGLGLRGGPGPDFSSVGELKRGDLVEVQVIGGSDAWVRWGPGQWTALQAGGRVFLSVDDGSGTRGAAHLAVVHGGSRRQRPRSDDG